MFAEGGGKRPQGTARAAVGQGGVKDDLGCRQRRQAKLLANFRQPNGGNAVRQRSDRKAGHDRSGDRCGAAAEEDLHPANAGRVQGAGGIVAHTA